MPPPSDENFKGTETVLVVEDDAKARQLICRMVKEQGYHTLEAGNGLEALEIAKSYRDDGRKIDLLLSDVVMPRMGGGKVALEIRSLHPQIKILFTSGYLTDTGDHGILDPDMAFLAKPFLPSDLHKKIRQILDSK